MSKVCDLRSTHWTKWLQKSRWHVTVLKKFHKQRCLRCKWRDEIWKLNANAKLKFEIVCVRLNIRLSCPLVRAIQISKVPRPRRRRRLRTNRFWKSRLLCRLRSTSRIRNRRCFRRWIRRRRRRNLLATVVFAGIFTSITVRWIACTWHWVAGFEKT